MLSDSLFDTIESIWNSIQDYDYAREHETELIEALTNLSLVIHHLDHLKADPEWNISHEEMRRRVKREWDRMIEDNYGDLIPDF